MMLRRKRIDAALELAPSVYWTPDKDGATDLERELSRRQRAGIGGTWLSERALYRLTGIRGAVS